MVPLSLGMAGGVAVNDHERFHRFAIWIFVRVIGVGMVSPMLLKPYPSISPHKVGAQSQQMVDPRSPL